MDRGKVNEKYHYPNNRSTFQYSIDNRMPERVQSAAIQQGKTKQIAGSTEPIGTAKMLADHSIVLNLRAETDGSVGHAQFEYKKGDPKYVEILSHIGGLKPGQEKSVSPFTEK